MDFTEEQRQQEYLLLDPHRRILRFECNGILLIGKRCLLPAGRREFDRAAEAYRRLHCLTMPGSPSIQVVVPEIIEAGGGECVLVTPDLGDPLSMDVDLAMGVLPLPILITILGSLLTAGVEAPGFIPRNLFYRDDRLYVIDWEDADFTESSAAPDELTTMKWDIAWSDVYRVDPGIRRAIKIHRTGEPSLDSFERTLLSLMGAGFTPADVRVKGIDLTLRSELHVPGLAGVTAAALGHLAEEILPARHSVLHTLLTARLRTARGERAYAQALTGIWNIVRTRMVTERRGDQPEKLQYLWLQALVEMGDLFLQPKQAGRPLTELHHDLSVLATNSGWTAACRRAELAEALLVRVCDLVLSTLGLADIELILRGSLAQGLLTRHSDIDFELSSPQYPNGHNGAEQVVLDILALFGLEAEASTSRPVEVDLFDPHSGLTRDLHEWMELRKAGSHLHDPGWLRHVFTPTVTHLVDADSNYEKAGRKQSAKYAWFEARALLARLAFRYSEGSPPVAIPQQLNLLKGVNEEIPREIHEILQAALNLRESDTSERVHSEVRGRSPLSWVSALV